MKASTIKTMPIRQLVHQSSFLERIHALGRSAENMRESHFDIIISPESNRFIITPPKRGNVTNTKSNFTKFLPPDDLSAMPIVSIHNHPYIGDIKKYAWTDFFSEDDMNTYFWGSEIGGLVYLPARNSSLLLLLTQHPCFLLSEEARGKVSKGA
ncbi:MAG: hypothetical protein ABIJ26_07030, partial [Candidatus Margulisiibacteriota bacterium]